MAICHQTGREEEATLPSAHTLEDPARTTGRVAVTIRLSPEIDQALWRMHADVRGFRKSRYVEELIRADQVRLGKLPASPTSS